MIIRTKPIKIRLAKRASRHMMILLGSLLLWAVLFFSACNSAVVVNGPPPASPTVTATLNISMWGVAPLTATPSPIPPSQPSTAGPSQTPPAPLATVTPLVETPSSPTLEPSPVASFDPQAITHLVFTGSIVPGRCVQAAIDQRGGADYLYAEVFDLLGSADLTVGTLNAAISDYPPATGCIQTFVLVGGSENADAMAKAGFDLMSVSTNHIKNCGLANCGDRAFLDTLENLQRVAIQPIGGGLDLAEALQPVYVTLNGVRFGFVALGEIEASAFAGPQKPGTAPLNDENLRTILTEVRQQVDVLILLPHWGSDYSFLPNPGQLGYARLAVELGADLVVGNHSHVIQGMQTIQGVPVFYSLGSFVFDQTWIPVGETEPVLQQGLVLQVTFQGSQLLDYELIPVRIADDKSGQVQVAGPLEAADILERFIQISAELD